MNRTRLLALLLAAMMTVPAQMTAAAAQPQTAVQTGSVAVTQEDKSVETSLSSLENTTVGTTTEFTVTTRGESDPHTTVYGCFTVNSSEPNLGSDGDMTIEYYETAELGQGWHELPSNYFGPEEGFPFNALGNPMESRFKVTFHKPGSYEIVVLIKEKDGDEVVCQTASFTVNVTEEEPEEPGLIKSEEELRSAIAKGGTVELEDGADIVLTSQLTISNAVTIKAGTNAKIRAEGTMRSFGDSIVTVSGVSANFENVAIDAGDQAEYALTYTDGASGTLTGVTVSGGTGSDLLVDGANVTLGSGTSAGQTELAKTGSGTPKLAVQSGGSTKVWVDHDTYTALGMSEDDLEEQLAALVSSESGTVEAVVGTQPGSSAENGTPVTVQPDDADGGDEDDGEEIQPEEKTSRTGGDYFGNAKWAEVKAQIAAAEEGDTIEMSGTGLPWFPSSVARALKGKDVTLEIRKNGVTYTLNGQKIGPITKIWYNFDENLETTLQPVEE